MSPSASNSVRPQLGEAGIQDVRRTTFKTTTVIVQIEKQLWCEMSRITSNNCFVVRTAWAPFTVQHYKLQLLI